ncbi:cora-domain-containing protein [Pholiota conissans]|uniref:Cora-domain-containing protein n=1 Tax=Pholiota conissans TaxID=109636 RepID=A0A9P6CTH1_9AGAR|nr:cora-domain-containing protein [Pholiota conissans]
MSIDSPPRRSVSPSEQSDLARLRHSPALSRSFDLNDPQVRERQRTMDVDMALQLSLARRDTLHSSPIAAFSSPQLMSPDDDEAFAPPQQDFSLLDDPAADINFGADDHDDPDAPIQPSLRRISRSDPSLLSHHHISPLTLGEDAQASNLGLPTYQANVSQSAFDFTGMEEFAAQEKVKLGLNSPNNARFSLVGLPRRPKLSVVEPQIPPPAHSPEVDSSNANAIASSSHLPVAPGDAGPQPPADAPEDDQASARPLRHRKLSQSNAHPRSHRKGIGGKMALFESTSADPPSSFSTRLGQVLGHPSTMASGPSYDPAGAGLPVPGGILNTGHARPYRFSFYSNALSATIHARSLAELPAEGQTFAQLFSGIQPPSDSQDGTTIAGDASAPGKASPPYQEAARALYPGAGRMNGAEAGGLNGRNSAMLNRRVGLSGGPEKGNNGGMVGAGVALDTDGDGNTWWLDVQNPTDEEMKMLSKVFSIHPLTTEDILMEETREKIELFRNYYLVCFRSFDQDPYSPTHLEPLNMYIIVFREGILSFHFRPTPHPQNVRRRIKQLKDYISVTSDWISYALIDDITDAFGPLIQGIEYEVDSIDELVLILKEAEQSDMLRRIGTCRKKVMGLLRLMGNKADVVKGLAKRCNENWRVAPTSDIGLYLSDIQDHLITMTQNLNHYEKILSRSHSNYLAQISIEMTDANNQINDVLSKLTALGTVLIPMNLVTGLWGMNVHVPGQDVPGYAWFISIIACLAAFAVVGGYSTYRFMVRK